MIDLAWLLAPLGVQGFLDELFGDRHHHIRRGDPGYFTPLLDGPTAVDELLAQLRDEPAGVHAVRGAASREAAAYRLPDGTLNTAAVRHDLADGYTVILDNLERYVRSLGGLTHALEVELNYPTQLNAYLSPPGSRGFLPHYDHHDVLVLQIHGRKTWHLYGDAAVTPHDMRRRKEVADVFGGDLPEPTDLVLEAGDTLYLPRGRVHAAETGAEPSVHLTVGIHVPTVLDLLTHMLQLLSFTDDRIHTRLAARYLDDPGVRADLPAVVDDALGLLTEPTVIAGGLDAFEDLLVRRGRLPPVGRVSDVVDIDEQTLVRKHRPLYSRVVNTDGRVALQFAQLLISAAPDHEAALRFASDSSTPFRVGELPGLTPQQRIELARQLLTSGFLVRLASG
ncbi:cupin [Mycobacterium sp. M1]|uniref:Cupin n=1 Tax=Mycolicibacter acidiphilus TaxID=2835306 RepID=A0ABS5RLF6_9MYCO|nr:cupin domain-containing protein [Mycolicibacter acidiphilus]MBS9534413.1 cupin [Mycolicibacter acidiphilus]